MVTSHDGTERVKFTSAYENGREIRTHYSVKGDVDHYTVEEHNDRGHCFRSAGYDRNRFCKFCRVRELLPDGEPVKETWYNAYGVVYWVVYFPRDAAGKLLGSIGQEAALTAVGRSHGFIWERDLI